MKHPKLKQTVLCQALLYAPFVVFSVGGLALGILLCEVLPTWLFVMVLFSGCCSALPTLSFFGFCLPISLTFCSTSATGIPFARSMSPTKTAVPVVP